MVSIYLTNNSQIISKVYIRYDLILSIDFRFKYTKFKKLKLRKNIETSRNRISRNGKNISSLFAVH